MPNKFKYKSVNDNLVTIPFSSIGNDGSGQSNIGTREFISDNHVRITDTNSNTRQTHLISNIAGGQEYTVSVEFKKLTGTPTFRFQIQGYIGGSYARTIKFTNTEETGIRDIDGWQIASWTFTLAENENAVRLWWQDGADYTTYTHSFELKNPDLRISEAGSIFKGNWAIDTSSANSAGGPSNITRLYHGAPIPNGGYTVYSSNRVFRANTDAELLGKVRNLGGDWGSIPAALSWAAGESTVIVLNKAFDNQATDGLVLKLDTSHVASFVDNKPTTNLLAAYNDNFVRAVTWTNSGHWTYTHFATNNDKPIIDGIDLSNVNLMYGKSVTTGSQHFGCTSVTVSPNETYTMSVYYYHSRAGASRPYMRTGVNNNNLGYMSYNGSTNTSSWPVGQWIRVSVTATVQSNENLVYLSNYLGSQADDQVWYCAPQVESGTEMTAFAKGTRLQNTTLYDLSNTDGHGTLINTPTFNSNGYLTFDGIDDSMQIPQPPTNMTDGMSIELLIKSGATNSPFVICPLSHGIDAYVRMNSSSRIYMGVIPAPDSSVQTLWTQSSLSADRFHRVTFTYKQSIGGTAYFDGALEDSEASLYTALDWEGVWNIGQRGNGTYFADMDLAGMKVYDKALSQSEILQNYHQAPIVTDGLVLAIDAGNLVSYEEDSTTAYDLVGTETASLVNSVGFDKNNGGHWTFDGVDDHINLGNPTIARNSEFSVSFFYNPSTVQNSTHNGIINGKTPNGRFCLFWYGGNRVSVQYRDNSGLSAANGGVWQRASTLSTLSADNWYFIQITGNENTGEFKCGVNLIESPVSNSSQYVDPDANNWIIGRRAGGAYDHSKVANLMVYNRILTSKEMAQNFNAQRNRFGI